MTLQIKTNQQFQEALTQSPTVLSSKTNTELNSASATRITAGLSSASGITGLPDAAVFQILERYSLTFRRLMSTIVDVSHREPPKFHFTDLFNKYRYRIF